MDDLTRQRLVELNQQFYSEFAPSFSETRREPQPGFFELEKYFLPDMETLLDVGCGEGRLGRFLLERGRTAVYDGIDGSAALIDIARRTLSGQFWQRDLTDADALRDVGCYDIVACLAVLQHIPGREYRAGLMASMGRHLHPYGRLVVSTWQFLSSERQMRKIADWGEVGLHPDQLETNDYLLTWRRGGRGLRYVNYIDEQELHALARQAGLSPIATFRSDGREGNLNLYAVYKLEENSSLGDG